MLRNIDESGPGGVNFSGKSITTVQGSTLLASPGGGGGPISRKKVLRNT